MKNIIKIMIMASLFCGCYNSRSNCFMYGTEQYAENTKNAEIKIDSAFKIAAKVAYYANNGEYDTICLYHSFLIDGQYVFTGISINWKVAEQSISGYWVDIHTGQLKNVETDDYADLQKIYGSTKYLDNTQNLVYVALAYFDNKGNIIKCKKI